MRELATGIITRAAKIAGLPDGRVIGQVKSDSLLLPRPRIELQFLPASCTRSGRTLAFERKGAKLVRKRELYEVDLDVAANVLADDDEWLSGFCYAFVAALPLGTNDKRGNWVKIRTEKATFAKAPDTRVGETVIEVFRKTATLFELTFTFRITADEAIALIPTFTIETTAGAYHG